MTSRPVTPLHCRVCGQPNDAHTYAKLGPPHVPHDGDISLCAYCCTWSVFEGGGLRAPTAEEAADIATSPDCQRAMTVLLEVQRDITAGKKNA